MSGGFRPVNDINGAPYNGQVQSVYATASHATLLQVGDFVSQSGDVTTLGDVSYPNVDAATASSLIAGVIIGVDFNQTYVDLAKNEAKQTGIFLNNLLF